MILLRLKGGDMEKQYKWQPIELDLKTFMNYIRSMGAASIKEIKDHFHTDSASVRRAVGFLYHHQKVWLIPYKTGLYVTENTHKRGRISIAALRKTAGVVPKKRGPKSQKTAVKDMPQTTTHHEWRDEQGQLKVDIAEDW
jgi:hypothetical protein